MLIAVSRVLIEVQIVSNIQITYTYLYFSYMYSFKNDQNMRLFLIIRILK